MDFFSLFEMHFQDVCASANGSLRVPLKKACHLLRIATQTVYNKRREQTWDDKRLPIQQDGRRLYISCRDLARELARRDQKMVAVRRRRGRSTIREIDRAQALGLTVPQLREREISSPDGV